MKKNQSRKQIEQLWEHSIQQAAEDAQDTPELDEAMLTNTAGLHVQAGVKAGWGDWSVSACHSCRGATCTCIGCG